MTQQQPMSVDQALNIIDQSLARISGSRSDHQVLSQALSVIIQELKGKMPQVKIAPAKED